MEGGIVDVSGAFSLSLRAVWWVALKRTDVNRSWGQGRADLWQVELGYRVLFMPDVNTPLIGTSSDRGREAGAMVPSVGTRSYGPDEAWCKSPHMGTRSDQWPVG